MTKPTFNYKLLFGLLLDEKLIIGEIPNFKSPNLLTYKSEVYDPNSGLFLGYVTDIKRLTEDLSKAIAVAVFSPKIKRNKANQLIKKYKKLPGAIVMDAEFAPGIALYGTLIEAASNKLPYYET